MADGVIVGSAIVGRIAAAQQDPAMAAQVGQFVHSLKDAIRSPHRLLQASYDR
jgi:tryptophan synthase alpha subunit